MLLHKIQNESIIGLRGVCAGKSYGSIYLVLDYIEFDLDYAMQVRRD